MNENYVALLTFGLGEIFLLALMFTGTWIIYFRFAQPDPMTIDIDSIEIIDHQQNY